MVHNAIYELCSGLNILLTSQLSDTCKFCIFRRVLSTDSKLVVHGSSTLQNVSVLYMVMACAGPQVFGHALLLKSEYNMYNVKYIGTEMPRIMVNGYE